MTRPQRYFHIPQPKEGKRKIKITIALCGLSLAQLSLQKLLYPTQNTNLKFYKKGTKFAPRQYLEIMQLYPDTFAFQACLS